MRLSGFSRARRAFARFAVAACTLAAATAAQAADLVVKYDQSQLLRMPRPVAEIIIGNPSIADVTVQASNLLVITGKSFGITNIIALDDERNIIQDQRVIVQRDQRKVVNLHRGDARRSYNCSPQCNPSIIVGDDEKYFASIAGNASTKMKISEGSGAAAGPGGR